MAAGIRIALYQPDIAGNTGTILRMAACLGVAVDIIEPAGFDVSDRNLRRAGMDYLEMAALTRHVDFEPSRNWRRAEGRRLVLFSTRAALPYTDFAYADRDILLFGRESAGVPDHVHDLAEALLLIPMKGGGRSLNVALAPRWLLAKRSGRSASTPAVPQKETNEIVSIRVAHSYLDIHRDQHALLLRFCIMQWILCYNLNLT